MAVTSACCRNVVKEEDALAVMGLADAMRSSGIHRGTKMGNRAFKSHEQRKPYTTRTAWVSQGFRPLRRAKPI
jgi:hypothetical protein